jgi:hypothetical protein
LDSDDGENSDESIDDKLAAVEAMAGEFESQIAE